VVAQAIVIAGIIIAIYTHKDNVFSAPEYSGGSDGKTWFHVLAHLILGLIIGPLIVWLIGCVLLFIVKKVVPEGATRKASA
jgi:hypothetical protein